MERKTWTITVIYRGRKKDKQKEKQKIDKSRLEDKFGFLIKSSFQEKELDLELTFMKN